MIKRAVAFVVVAWASFVGGCATSTTTDHGTRFDGKSPDAMVVLGFSARLPVWIAPGVDDGMNWHPCGGETYAYRIRPEEGFVVARLPAMRGKQKYGITAIGNLLDAYGPSGAVSVFNAEPGKVTYLGALRVVWSGSGGVVMEDPAIKESDADDFVTRTFPNIPVHVVPGRMEVAYKGAQKSDGCR